MADTPTYWSIDPSTYDTWVRVLGAAAAGKLMAACCGYFFHGADPDDFKLSKTARVLFDGERQRLDRRRASAINGTKSVRRKRDAGPRATGKSAGKSGNSLGKVAEKSTENQAPAQQPTSENANSRLAPVLNLSPNTNPQTPAPRAKAARGSGIVSRAEFDAMVAAGLGYGTPTAYGRTG